MLLRLLGVVMSDDPPETTHGVLDKAVFAVCELLALAFGLPFGEDLYRGTAVSRDHLLYLSIGILFAVAGVAPSAIRLMLKNRQKPVSRLQYLHTVDTELGAAIRMVAWRSALGKLYAAQFLVSKNPQPVPEERVMQWIASTIQRALASGELEAHGRLPGQMDFRPIPRTHWFSTGFAMRPDGVTLWQLVMFPTGGAYISPDWEVTADDPAAETRTAQLKSYDSIIMNSRQIEKLWPVNDAKIDKELKRLLKQAKKAGADQAEIDKLWPN